MNKRLLFHFDAEYYSYPVSVSRNYQYPLIIGLSPQQLKYRQERKQSFEKNKCIQQINFLLNNYFDECIIDINLLREHGIFFERFYKLDIKNDVVKKVMSDEKQLSELVNIFKGDKTYGNLIEKEQYITSFILEFIFEYQLYKLLESMENLSIMNDWYERYSGQKKCLICGNSYRVIDIPDWLYFWSNGNKLCCFQCEIMKKPLKRDLMKIIPAFVNKCGFIPKVNSHPLEYSFASRFTQEEWLEITKLFGEMGGIPYVKKKFGSWFKAMVDTKAIPNGSKITSRGLWCIANDGHQCHSIDEQIIDNWLYLHNIEHSRKPLYPYHNSLNPHGKRRADWKVENVFIEYFGLVGDKNYDRNMQEKIMLAAIKNISLIEIYPCDLNSLQTKLGILIKS